MDSWDMGGLAYSPLGLVRWYVTVVTLCPLIHYNHYSTVVCRSVVLPFVVTSDNLVLLCRYADASFPQVHLCHGPSG